MTDDDYPKDFGRGREWFGNGERETSKGWNEIRQMCGCVYVYYIKNSRCELVAQAAR